jgi:hypothetical protein
LAMSVNDVPDWLVTMPPSLIGVPVATTPGLVPQSDVLTAVLVAGGLLDVVVDGLLVVVVLLPHPAAAARPSATAMAATTRTRGACARIPTSWWF